MTKMPRIALISAALAAITVAPVAAQSQKIRASKIILVGDSTVAVQGGWGPSFCADHVTSFAACVNLARGGRSSGNYRSEGSWDLALAEMKTPGFVKTFVLIQFGHNDQPGKPGRSTDLATEFPVNMRRYVEEVRAAGAVPVLVTPLTRRMFSDGRVSDDLLPWAQAVKRVAAEMRVPLVDLHARSNALVQAMGPALANRFAQRPPSPTVAAAAIRGETLPSDTGQTAAPAQKAAQDNAAAEPMGQAKLSFDYTHLGREGADMFAAMVTAELARTVPDIRPLLVP